MKGIVGKRIVSILLALLILLPGMAVTGHAAAGDEKSDIPFDSFETDAGFTDTENGFRLSGSGGDHAVTSTVSAKALEFEADVKLLDGGVSAALVIGKENTDPWPGIAVNIDKDSGVAKLFKEPGNKYNNMNHPLSDEQMESDEFHLKITADANGLVVFYLDGEKIFEKQDDDYQGGRVGLLTWNSTAVFNNIRFVNNDSPSEGFRTNLENVRGLQGTWNERADGLYSRGSNDVFAVADTKGTDFIYTGTVTYADGQTRGAGSLVFRSTDDCKTCYVANVDRSTKNTRIFKFVNGNYVGDIIGGALPVDKDSYELRVEAFGSMLKLYVDDVLIGAKEDADPLLSGNFGFLTNNSSIVYQDVYQTPVDPSRLPTLSGLVVEAGGGNLITFNEDITTYTALLENSVTSVKVTPSTDAANTLRIGAVQEDTTVILPEQGIKSGMASPEIPLAVGTNTINVKVKDEDGIEIITSVNVLRKIDRTTAYQEAYRPQLHFTTLKNFINDPNGLVFDPSNDTWHMFYQYNPTGMAIGNQVWGHAQSTDLVNWEELPIAIPQGDGLGAIFSGSAVVDENNTSGFFSDNVEGESKLVAIFTHSGGDNTQGHEKQSIAYSKDHGLTWNLYEGNPVIGNPGNMYGGDFRDPKVFWHDGQWLLVVAGGRARLFSSDNLIDWKHESAFYNQDGSAMYSECPDLYPMPHPETGETKWVFTASGRWYTIGDLRKNADGNYEFYPETERIKYNADTGYATQTFYNDGSGEERRIAVHWLQEYTGGETWVSTVNIRPDKVWNGTQTIGQVTTLTMVNGNLRLNSYPVEEIKQQRGDAPVVSLQNETVSENSDNILAGLASKKYDIETTIDVGTATEVGFRLMTGNGKHVTVKYDDIGKEMILDRQGVAYPAGTTNGASVQSTEMYKDEDGKIKFRIIMDVSVIEVFGNDGDAAANHAFFTDPGNAGLEFYVKGGEATIESFDLYEMRSIYRDDIGGTSPLELFVGADRDKTAIEVGETVTLTASVVPMTATNKDVVWLVEANDAFEEIARTGNTITFKAVQEGTLDVEAETADGGITFETVTLKAITTNFITNMSGWKGVAGNWKKGDNGYTSSNKNSGDSFAIATDKADTFIYEAEISNVDGTAVGLVFGVQNPEAPSSAPWFCVNFEKSGNGKLFYNSGSREIWKEDISLTQEQKDAATNKLKVVVLENGTIQYYIDDVLMTEKADSGFVPGAFGLITYHASADFNYVYLTNTGGSVNKNALNDAIAKADALVAEEYTPESWENLSNALTGAKAVAADGLATQEDVDAAEAALNDAIDALVPVAADLERLKDLVDEAKEKKEGDYTTGTWAPFKKALDAANDVLEAQNPTAAQAETAYNALFAAMTTLQTRGDATSLETMLRIYTKGIFDGRGYKQSRVDHYEAMRAAVVEICGNAGAYTQSEMSEAAANLTDAFKNIGPIVVGLETMIDTAEELLASGTLTQEAYDALSSALDDALDVWENSMDQKEITTATDMLSEAISNAAEPGDIGYLLILVDIAEGLARDMFDDASLAKLDDAMAIAYRVINELDEPTKGEVAHAVNAMEEALFNMELRLNYEALDAAIARAQGILANADDYVDSTIAGLPAALIDAQTVRETAKTQEAITEATKSLSEKAGKARKKEDLSRLQDLIGRAKRLNRALYTPTSLSVLDNALALAMSMTVEDQPEDIKNAEKIMESALNGLALLDTTGGGKNPGTENPGSGTPSGNTGGNLGNNTGNNGGNTGNDAPASEGGNEAVVGDAGTGETNTPAAATPVRPRSRTRPSPAAPAAGADSDKADLEQAPAEKAPEVNAPDDIAPEVDVPAEPELAENLPNTPAPLASPDRGSTLNLPLALMLVILGAIGGGAVVVLAGKRKSKQRNEN